MLMIDNSRNIIEGGTDIVHNYTGLWTSSNYGSTPFITQTYLAK